MMESIEILQKWAEYTAYDPNQTKFNLLSSQYELHRCNDNIAALTNNYDPTGTLAVVYAKNTFQNVIRKQKLSLYDVLVEPQQFDSTRAMWELFQSKEITAMEDQYLNSINTLVEQVVGRKMLGSSNPEAERETLFNSVSTVVEQLKNCKEELFLKGGSFAPMRYISTHIHVFERLADCLLALETAKDGIYLCYINIYGSADGYFGFFLKNNSNILAVDERIDEAYVGQHHNSRNGRWAEEKKYNLFPYDFIFNFSDFDYKGYANKHMIDMEKLNFFELGADAYLPLLLAMLMLNNKYAGKTVDLPLKYTNSLVEVNLLSDSVPGQALIVPENSQLVAHHQKLKIPFTLEDVLSGKAAERYDAGKNKDKHYSETGCFPNHNQLMVDLYGEGFSFQPEALLEANPHLKQITAGKEAVPNCEFVGTQARMELQAYYVVRKQLAEHIRDNIYAEFIRFGGIDAVRQWYEKTLLANLDKIHQACVNRLNILKSDANLANLSIQEKDDYLHNNSVMHYQYGNKLEYESSLYSHPSLFLNPKTKANRYYMRACNITGSTATIYFDFFPRNWLDIEELLGCEVPRIVKGWELRRYGCGNSLLNSTDAVEEVGTPFESAELQRNPRYKQMTRPLYDFSFAIGFSKRGWAQVVRQANDGGERT